MRFKIDGNIKTHQFTHPAPEAVRRPVPQLTEAEKEPICRACKDFKSDLALPRCNAKCTICPGSSARIKPWRNMPRCPKNLWTVTVPSATTTDQNPEPERPAP